MMLTTSASGYDTCVYNVAENGDPNTDFDPEKEPGETQFLIKWVGWAHLHNTWETRQSLLDINAKGLKKLENYVRWWVLWGQNYDWWVLCAALSNISSLLFFLAGCPATVFCRFTFSQFQW